LSVWALSLLACIAGTEGAEARTTSRRGYGTWASIGIVGIVITLALLAALATFVVPGSVLGGDTVKVAAGAIFAGTYLALAIGKIPSLRIDRAGVALVGASLMVGAGVLALGRPAGRSSNNGNRSREITAAAFWGVPPAFSRPSAPPRPPIRSPPRTASAKLGASGGARPTVEIRRPDRTPTHPSGSREGMRR